MKLCNCFRVIRRSLTFSFPCRAHLSIVHWLLFNYDKCLLYFGQWYWWTDIEIWEMMLPKVQYFTLYLTRCPKSNCYLSNNISKEALFQAIFDRCPSFEITSLKMYFLNLYLIFSPHENSICIVSTKFNHLCLQQFLRNF